MDKRFFSSSEIIQTGSGAHPASLFNRYQGLFPGVRRPERDADHSPPSNAEVKNEWGYSSTPPICFHGVDRGNLLYFYSLCAL